ncbi:hypothetical protein [Nguyenibacter sp. L1]|uniref:hypothetical protein n=1 Tax=Nguyenibacter sp. L1 TaxID=3049350 RepID=UPI002B471BCC|nr:hypothetical protein [Nguyenibacter sp. L1]WRH89577.1 hypothetical protein QN315_08305 [Nguyenibacter sp. L1]
MTEESAVYHKDFGKDIYDAEIRVMRPEPKVFRWHGHEYEDWFDEMSRGPLHDELEERAAAGATEADLTRWLEAALGDERFAVLVTLERDEHGVAIMADIARIGEIVAA